MIMQFAATTRPQAESPLAGLLREPALQPHRIQLPPKAVIYQPADPAKSIYFIQHGQVRTYQTSGASRRMVELLGPGEWCGAASLARHQTYGEAAEAIVPTTLTIIAADRLFAYLAMQPSAAAELIHQLAAKLTAFREDAAGLVFEDCNRRLVRTLVTLSQSPAASHNADGVIVHITHQQLAQKVGVARETVSLALAQLRRRNLLRTGRNQLIFKPQTLKDWTPAPTNGHSNSAAETISAAAGNDE
jgi:CRP/FNR family transcriptional regulator, cyclic AMP receptor protein